MKIYILLIVSSFIFTASSFVFGGNEEKFLKKYAVLKIYEGCFGPEAIKQIRKEMKAAVAKCAESETPSSTTSSPPQKPPSEQTQPTFDAEKLHQAILAYRPGSAPPNYRPYQPPIAPFYNPPYTNPAYQGPLFYTGYPQLFSPYGGFPLVGQPFYGNRVSRDMGIGEQLDGLSSKMGSKLKNIRCFMKELGYTDENLKPNYQRIIERIGNLSISADLKQDIQDGVTFCEQFSQCVPDVKKDKSPLFRELIKPLFFFRCYKHKKLEACIMKDLREKYEVHDDDDLDNDVDLTRTGKAQKIPQDDNETDETMVYEYLFGSESNIIDGVL